MFTIPCEQFKRLFDVLICNFLDPFGRYICFLYTDYGPGPGPFFKITNNDIATLFIFLVWCVVVNHWPAIFHKDKAVMKNERYFIYSGLYKIASFEGFILVHLYSLPGVLSYPFRPNFSMYLKWRSFDL